MNRTTLLSELQAADVEVIKESRIGNNKGTRFGLKCRAVVILYDTGTVVVAGRGPNVSRLRKLVGTGKVRKSPHQQKPILIVSGRDRAARNDLKATLKNWGLKPISLKKLSDAGSTADKLWAARNLVRFAIVLATPDDVGYRKGKPDTKTARARQSILFKLGLLTAHLGYNKVAVLAPDDHSIDLPSDIPNRLLVPYKKDVTSAKAPLMALLRAKGVALAPTDN